MASQDGHRAHARVEAAEGVAPEDYTHPLCIRGHAHLEAAQGVALEEGCAVDLASVCKGV